MDFHFINKLSKGVWSPDNFILSRESLIHVNLSAHATAKKNSWKRNSLFAGSLDYWAGYTTHETQSTPGLLQLPSSFCIKTKSTIHPKSHQNTQVFPSSKKPEKKVWGSAMVWKAVPRAEASKAHIWLRSFWTHCRASHAVRDRIMAPFLATSSVSLPGATAWEIQTKSFTLVPQSVLQSLFHSYTEIPHRSCCMHSHS